MAEINRERQKKTEKDIVIDRERETERGVRERQRNKGTERDQERKKR